MSEVIFLVEEAPEGGYTARALGEAIFTEAETPGAMPTALRGHAHRRRLPNNPWDIP